MSCLRGWCWNCAALPASRWKKRRRTAKASWPRARSQPVRLGERVVVDAAGFPAARETPQVVKLLEPAADGRQRFLGSGGERSHRGETPALAIGVAGETHQQPARAIGDVEGVVVVKGKS